MHYIKKLIDGGSKKRKQHVSRSRRRARIESLEDRRVLATFIVETATDAVPAPEGSLRYAIEQANQNPGADTIKFKSVGGSISLVDQLTITDDLTIKGPGADKLEVSGGSANRVFAVVPSPIGAPPTVSIHNLTVADGLAMDAPGYAGLPFGWGGGLYNLAGTVSLEGVHFLNNQAGSLDPADNIVVGAGGAIANEFGGTVHVTRGQFTGNSALGLAIVGGGAIAQDMGPAGPSPEDGTTVPPTLDVDRSSFESNVARTAFGRTQLPDPFLTEYSGFALGGAIVNVTGFMTVRKSEFLTNQAIGGSGFGTFMDEPAAGGQAVGGAIASFDIGTFGSADSVAVLRQNKFIGNLATGGDGAAEGAHGGNASGGAVAVTINGDADLRQNLFEANVATGGQGTGASGRGGDAIGGGVAGLAGATLALRQNSFVGNHAKAGVNLMDTENFDGLDGVGRGGGLGLGILDVDDVLEGDLEDPSDDVPVRDLIPSATVALDRYTENRAGGSGGGIFSLGTLDVRNAKLSENVAYGGADSVQVINPVTIVAGGAIGGGISNEGTLSVRNSQFTDNRSEGADDIDPLTTTFTDIALPGGSWGGAISNSGTSNVSHSRFVGNSANAGDRNSGDYAGIGAGGAIYNDQTLTVSHSQFRSNQAIGGDDNVSPFHNGHALGGAIGSGTLGALVGLTAEATVEHSNFQGNEALGGHNNTVLLPSDLIPLADGPNSAYGGAILIYQGSADLSALNVSGNLAQGGDGGAEQNGSTGVGGGIFLFSFLGSVEAQLERVNASGNMAVGGQTPEGRTGAGIGGGVAAGALGAPFGAPSNVSITRSNIGGNVAYGGVGGGIFNDGNLSITKSNLNENRAEGMADVLIDFIPGYTFVGAALGGGMSNVGTVEITDTHMNGNEAVGADGAEGGFALLGQEVLYPGIAVGGALHNIDTASIHNSHVEGNQSWGGSFNVGSFAGLGEAGGLYNDGTMEVSRSSVRGNRAVGGNSNTGDINVGGGAGGGIVSGSVTVLAGLRSGDIHVSQTSVIGNEAVGGDGNMSVAGTLPLAHAPAGAFGGGILVYQGDATISSTEIADNLAAGGENGGAVGGGIVFVAFAGTVNGEILHSSVVGNVAIGGTGSGDAYGGGIATGSLGSFFSLGSIMGMPDLTNVMVNIEHSDVIGNVAQGGQDSGDGLGGGIYNGSDAKTVLSRSTVTENEALGASGGVGMGGGIYNLGDLELIHAEIFANYASTSDDDCFNC